jgi:hypothetical protein
MLLGFTLCSASPAAAQGTAGTGSTVEPRALVDLPTAGMLRSGGKAFEFDFFHQNGITAGFTYGVWDRLMVGFSFGGVNIIGTDAATFQRWPGIQAKFRIADESGSFPALALGFDSQGKEEWSTDPDRYKIKSMGLYAVISKNYEAAGYLGFHGGLNYSFEGEDGDKDPNAFFGVDKSLGSFAAVTGEYSMALNDNSGQAYGRGRGYLNMGISVSPGAGVTFSLLLKDLLENQAHRGFANRVIRVEFNKQ